VDYKSAVSNCNDTLAKWDEAQATCEAVVEDLERMISCAVKFREMAIKCRDELIQSWTKAQPEEKKGSSVSDADTRNSLMLPVNLP